LLYLFPDVIGANNSPIEIADYHGQEMTIKQDIDGTGDIINPKIDVIHEEPAQRYFDTGLGASADLSSAHDSDASHSFSCAKLATIPENFKSIQEIDSETRNVHYKEANNRQLNPVWSPDGKSLHLLTENTASGLSRQGAVKPGSSMIITVQQTSKVQRSISGAWIHFVLLPTGGRLF